MIYKCKIYFQQPTTAALLECATLFESGIRQTLSVTCGKLNETKNANM